MKKHVLSILDFATLDRRAESPSSITQGNALCHRRPPPHSPEGARYGFRPFRAAFVAGVAYPQGDALRY